MRVVQSAGKHRRSMRPKEVFTADVQRSFNREDGIILVYLKTIDGEIYELHMTPAEIEKLSPSTAAP